MPQRTPVAEQLAAIPDLDRRIADLEKTLNAATDQKSLTATTARWILDVTKEVQKDPKAFDGRPVSNALRPSPAETPTRGATPSAAPPAPSLPPAPSTLSTKHSDYIATFGISMDFAAELKRAEALSADVKAGRDPLAGVTGDVHLQ